MTAFMSFSHGTQDVYPTFLEVQVGLKPATVGLIGVLYGLGSIAGGFVFGTLSERWGRKRAIITAALLSIPIIPLWAYGHSAFTLGTGAVLMQFMVQGAWGVVPAYLTELSPAPVRATAPGLAYQLGGLVTSWNGKGQALIAERWGDYPPVLAITVVVVALRWLGSRLWDTKRRALKWRCEVQQLACSMPAVLRFTIGEGDSFEEARRLPVLAHPI